jgi:adenylyl-sulfate kinase
MVIWIIGLSGSGKSTLANEIVSKVNKTYNNKTILIDGDIIRSVFNNDLGYSKEDRFKNAQRICQLGKFLDSQGINVVTAILSIFPENREWNRKNVKNYYEVFIDTPIKDLVNRDTKGFYKKFAKGQIVNVVGLDIPFTKPDKADLIIENTKTKEYLLKYADIIIEKVFAKQ